MALTARGAARRQRKTEALERPDYGWIMKPLLVLLVVAFLVAVGLGVWWSQAPARFEIEPATAEQRDVATPSARGTVTVAILMSVVETLIDKPGGYVRNDITPPGLWLDNMPNWETGVLGASRDLAHSLPAMAQGETTALTEAIDRLASDGDAWLHPSTEYELVQALQALDGYLASLAGQAGNGFVAGVGLPQWLDRVAKRLDELGRRLSANVGSRARLRDLGVEVDELPASLPWYRVDDVFFEARGTAWALQHFVAAVRHDQADVLERAGALDDWRRLIAELELSQRRLWSPVVLNGSGFGVFANHSLTMAHHVMRARDLAREAAEQLKSIPAAPAKAAPASRQEAASPTAPDSQGEGVGDES